MTVNTRTLSALSEAPLEESEIERIELARYFLADADKNFAAPPQALITQFETLIGDAHGVSPLDLFAPELIQKARDLMAQKAPRALMAAMLLTPAHRLWGCPALSEIPPWLLNSYATWRLAYVIIFLQPGEAQIYTDYLANTINDFYHSIIFRPTDRAPYLQEVFINKFNPLSLCTNNNFNRDAYRQQAIIIESYFLKSKLPVLHKFPETPPTGKLRVGIFVDLVNANPDIYYIISQFENFPRDRFDLILFYTSERDSHLNEYFFSLFDRKVQFGGDDYKASIDIIRQHDLDFLLLGTYRGCFFGFPANSFRLARIQALTPVIPNTTGFTLWDVYLTSVMNEAPGDITERYSEEVFTMPGMANYNAFGHDSDTQTITISRQDLGVPDTVKLFVSNASLYKVTPEIVLSWARILAVSTNSHLLLMPFGMTWQHYQPPAFYRALVKCFAAHNIALDRIHLQLSPFKTRADIQGLLKLCDVYLDSYPFSGGASILDPLFVHLPPVAWQGQTLRGRLASAMLCFAGLDELVTDTADAYEALAIKLARDDSYRQSMRDKMRDAFANGFPYYDTVAHSHHIHDAITTLCARRTTVQAHLRTLPTAQLQEAIATLSDRLAADHNHFFMTLSDNELVRLVVLPYYLSKPQTSPPHMIDVGACMGALSQPFLEQGWTADLFEPDPRCYGTLETLVNAAGGRARHFRSVIADTPEPTIPFHFSMVGLSGLSASPWGDTENLVNVPAIRLDRFTETHNVTQTDFLKIDAEGWDFAVLETHNFDRLAPNLVMVEFSTAFSNQPLSVINEAMATMRQKGYEALVISYEDDGNLKKQNWTIWPIGIRFGEALPNKAGDYNGNILFFRQDDSDFLAGVLDLLESYLPGSERVWTKLCG